MPTDATDRPDYVRPERKAVQADLDLMAHLLGGTRTMWENSASYIRKWKDEQPEVYDIRRKCEVVFEGLSRTLSAAVGMLFAKPPQMTWNGAEQAMTAHWDNIDAAGTHGDVFGKRYAEGALRDGYGVLLVDHPSPPDGVVVTSENEAKLNLRPTWAAYPRASVKNWRTGVLNNRQTVTMLVLHEPGKREVGKYGIEDVDRYRVLWLETGILDGETEPRTIAAWRLHEKVANPNGEDTFPIVPGGTGFYRNRLGEYRDTLPIAIGYTGRTDAALCATIPLLGVAWANLSHWQQATNLRFYRDLCAFPQPVLKGQIAQETGQNNAVVPGKLRVGPMVAIKLAEPAASFEWAEMAGTSMQQIVEGRDEALRQLSKLGVSFMSRDTRAPETAEAKRLDATSENSTLATAATGIQDSINEALKIHAWYLGIEAAQAPTLALSTDYESTGMPAEMLTAYVRAIADAGLPPRILVEAMQQGGLIPEGEDVDEIVAEMYAAQAAQEEAARQQREAQIAQLQAQNGGGGQQLPTPQMREAMQQAA